MRAVPSWRARSTARSLRGGFARCTRKGGIARRRRAARPRARKAFAATRRGAQVSLCDIRSPRSADRGAGVSLCDIRSPRRRWVPRASKSLRSACSCDISIGPLPRDGTKARMSCKRAQRRTARHRPCTKACRSPAAPANNQGKPGLPSMPPYASATKHPQRPGPAAATTKRATRDYSRSGLRAWSSSFSRR